MNGMYSSAHANGRRAQSEQRHRSRDKQGRAVSKLPNRRTDQGVDRARGSNHSDGTADDEHEENDVGGGGHSARNGGEESEGRQRSRFHFVEGSGGHLLALMSGLAH